MKLISLTIVLFWFLSLHGFSQDFNLDSLEKAILSETRLVNSIDVDSIGSLMIYSYVPETGGIGYAKGFLVENNIPGGVIDNTLPIPNCDDDCNVRMEATSNGEGEFIIRYKWRESKDFVVDTFFVFHHGNSYVAFPQSQYSYDGLKRTLDQWYSGPSSSDERDVVTICRREESVIFCYFNRNHWPSTKK